jgi:hypothetical protein
LVRLKAIDRGLLETAGGVLLSNFFTKSAAIITQLQSGYLL